MTLHLQPGKAGLAARLALALALAGAGAVHAEDAAPTTASPAPATQAESADTGNSLDDSGAFAAQPKRGVVIEEADFRQDDTPN